MCCLFNRNVVLFCYCCLFSIFYALQQLDLLPELGSVGEI